MAPRDTDIAIVGMSCLFPRAPNLRAYWENILAGVDAIGDPPPGSWTHDVFDPRADDNDRLYTVRGGYVGDLARFDPLAFGVMPKAVDGAEPEQFIALALARDALADAGYEERPFDRRRTGVIIGRGTYVNRGVISCFQHTIVIDQVLAILRQIHPEHPPEYLAALRRALKDSLPPFNPENSPGLAHSVLVGRIANRLDLMGPAFTVDAACASSLIAVDYGIRDLLRGSCDMVLAGGIQVSTTHPIALLFTQLGALARSGQVRPFHPEADGTLLGEGAGIVVLKRRDDAERDGDRIYAVIRAVGTSSDGKAMGVLAPRLEGEELAMRRAYDSAGVDPVTVGLIEAHGTGTPVGDAVEIEALRRLFPDRDGAPRIPFGSVKSMIGHCIPAAAAAGLIKAALAVHHRVLPPTLHADAANPRLEGSSLFLNGATRPWIHAGPHPRRAGVSAFGFGGINAHAVLEEAAPAGARRRRAQVAVPGPRLLHARRDAEIYLIPGASREEIAGRADALAAFIDAHPDTAPHDLAWSLAVAAGAASGPADAAGGAAAPAPAARPAGQTPLAIVAADLGELRRKLAYAAERLRRPDARRIQEIGGVYWYSEPLGHGGGLAFLFPGEGAQYAGMLADLCLHFPEARAWFDLMDRAFRDHPRGHLPSRFLFPPSIPGRAPESDRLFEMAIAIESVFAADMAMLAILDRLGLRPDAIVGHSTGEYAALIAAGAVDVEDDERLIASVREGNEVTERATRDGIVPPGVLLAVGPATPDVLRALTADPGSGLTVAMDNCPHQAVLCGDEAAIARAFEDLRGRGVICQRLAFERAYHTEAFRPVCEALRGYYERGPFRAPRVPLYSCATAAPMPADPAEVRRLALEQWALPVRFRDTVEAMHAAGIRLFVEVGPRGNLTAFTQDTLRGRPHVAVAANLPSRSGLVQLHHLLGMLAAHGRPLGLDPLYTDRGARLLPQEALFGGAPLPAPARRDRPLPMNLPSLRLGPEFLARVKAPASVAADAPAPGRSPAAGRMAPPPAVPVAPPPAVPIPVAAAPAGPGGPPVAVAAPASAPASASPRDAVMRGYLATMEQFLATQDAMMRALLRGPGAAAGVAVAEAPSATAAGARPAALPFLRGAAPRPRPDGSLVIETTLSLDEDLFLRDHTIGGRVSEDPGLRALPVLPLAMSLEIMAEAAVALRPGTTPTALRDVRVQRWIPLATGAATLVIQASEHPATGGVAVRIATRDGAADATPAPAVEAIVMLAAARPSPPPATPFAPRAARPCRWGPEALYSEREIHGMFHGPSLQGVAAVEAIGDDGATATLRALPARGLFRSQADPVFLLDPLTLDAASQVLGYWTAERLERAFVVFPFAIASVEAFAPSLRPPAAARVALRCAETEGGRLRADFEIAGADGRLLMRVGGWEVKRIDLPESLYAFRLAPRDVILGTRTAAPGPLAGRVRGCRLDLPLDFLDADGGIWWENLAHFVLAPAERAAWRALGGPRRRREWLLGRLAAKDAVRLHLLDTRGVRLFPADIEIRADEHGRPLPGGPALDRLGVSLAVSIAHTEGVAMAMTAEPARGIGIDIESVRRRRGAFEPAAFSPEEMVLLGAAHGAAQEERSLRLWCAKEAVAKALGRGLMGSPKNLEADAIDARIETIRMGVRGSLARAFPDLAGAPLTAYVERAGDLIVAAALNEA